MASPLSLFDRYKIIFYHQGLNGPKRNVKEISGFLNCNEDTVKLWIDRYKETGDVLDLPRSGRPKKTVKFQDMNIKKIALCKRKPSTRNISNYLKSKGLDISHATVSSRLREVGLSYLSPLKKPLLTEEARETRLHWALQHQDFNWENCLFSDETSFSLFGYDKKSWQDSGRSREVHQKMKHPPKIHAWGCFSAKGFGKLALFEENLDSDLMIDIYKNVLLPSIPMCFGTKSPRWILQEDNDPKHRSRKCTEWKINNQVQVMPWPTNSPDLNPIENVWALMKMKIATTKPATLRKLSKEIQNIWKSFDEEYARRLVDSIKNRIYSCITTHGDYTLY